MVGWWRGFALGDKEMSVFSVVHIAWNAWQVVKSNLHTLFKIQKKKQPEKERERNENQTAITLRKAVYCCTNWQCGRQHAKLCLALNNICRRWVIVTKKSAKIAMYVKESEMKWKGTRENKRERNICTSGFLYWRHNDVDRFRQNINLIKTDSNKTSSFSFRS